MGKKTVWNFFDRLEGDKVVWIITLILVLFSIVCIFSSSSRLVEGSKTRFDIVRTQMYVVTGGMFIILFLYNLRTLRLIRLLSSFGFLISLILSILLVSQIDIHNVLESIEINGARRILKVGGRLQIHVFEVVKIAMVMYLAWVQDAIKKKEIKWARNVLMQKIFFMYVPFISIMVLLMTGSISAGVLVGGIMFLTILLGGGNFFELSILALVAGAALFGCWTSYELSEGKYFNRIGTGINRVFEKVDYEKMFDESKLGSTEFYAALDKLRQPYGSKIAIHQGGLLGKGPGQSSQRYIVPDMSEDYIFSFIIEEYGILGAFTVIILYVSLLARGALIAKNCGNDKFAKLAVAGLTLLISGQALLHMFVNVDIGPMTGQTLPLISHGNSAFLCFSVAFGVILSISKIAKNRMMREEAEASLDKIDKNGI